MEINNTLSMLLKQVEAMQETIKAQRLDTQRYSKLRRLEIVIMSEDGAKYLKGGDLDKYIDGFDLRLTKKQVIDDALKIINDTFYTEYSKYGIDPRGESQEADKEATR